MKFEFAKATDITKFAKDNFEEMYKDYEKIYITPDTNDYHILRILKGYDIDYEQDENSVLLEENRVPRGKKDEITGLVALRKILEEDDGGNWGYICKDTVQECIDVVDGGYGIN